MPRNKSTRIERALDKAQAAKESILEARDSAESYVKKHPLTSIVLAAAVGALVALGVNALIPGRRKSFVERVKDLY